MTQRIASPFFASSLLALGLAASLGETAFATSLDDLRWKARPLVLFAPATDDPRLTDQIGQLKAAAAGLKDRDMVVVTVLAPQDPLRTRLKAPRDGFLMVLVGKDGHIAQRWTTPQNPANIFALIDRMPMRRDEMRRGAP